MKTIKQKNHFQLACLSADKMNQKPVNFTALRRKMSKHFKTTQTGNLITLHLKATQNGVRLSLLEIVAGTSFVSVRMSKRNNVEMVITAKSNKELLTKLLYKYECFN